MRWCWLVMLASLAACRFNFDDVARERDASTTTNDGDATAATLHFSYLKASNTGTFDHFGWAVALSGDGSTLAVGAVSESGSVPGINASDGSTNGISQSGAVYVYVRVGATWQQQAFIKQQALDVNDAFGGALALSYDGNTLAVGEPNEDSAATTINGSQTDNNAADAGACFIFARSAGTWTQQAYIKASNAEAGDQFGASVALSADGNTLAVGAPGEAGGDTTINGNKASNTKPLSGAAYLFTRSGSSWAEQMYFKAWNSGNGDLFGSQVALSDDGTTLVVGAPQEDGSLGGVQSSNFMDGTAVNETGAAYAFHFATVWSTEAYIKPSDVGFGGDFFGYTLSLSDDGNVLVCGAPGEDSLVSNSGAAWMFRRTGAVWAEEARLKASNPGDNDQFGATVAVAGNGTTVMVSAPFEDSSACCLDGDQTNDASQDSGAVYSFDDGSSGWAQTVYAKGNTPDLGDQFGFALALSHDAQTRAATATYEDSAATSIDGDAADNSDTDSGCADLYFYQ